MEDRESSNTRVVNLGAAYVALLEDGP